MPTVKVRFIDVGRGKKTWVDEVPCEDGLLDEIAMIKSIKKKSALMSKDIDIAADGSIYVGMFREVGRWEVLA